MKIGLTYNGKSEMREFFDRKNIPWDDDALEEYDSDETLDAVESSLAALGHRVERLGWGEQMIAGLSCRGPVDLVFNIAEGFGGRAREAQVPAFLDMLGIPYVGSDPLALALSLDKQATKDIVRAAGVHVPAGFLVRTSSGTLEQQRRMRRLDFPLVVKPAYEGSSKGVHEKSIVNDDGELTEQVRALIEKYKQPALVEEYIWGAEVTVGLLGPDPRVLAAMLIAPSDPRDAWPLYSIEVKRDFKKRVQYSLFPLSLELENAAKKAFQALGCRDMARIDFRIQNGGRPVFLEANPLPGLNPVSGDLCIMARLKGVEHRELLGQILEHATRRLALSSA